MRPDRRLPLGAKVRLTSNIWGLLFGPQLLREGTVAQRTQFFSYGTLSRRAKSGPPTSLMKSGSPQTTSWSRARDRPT